MEWTDNYPCNTLILFEESEFSEGRASFWNRFQKDARLSENSDFSKRINMSQGYKETAQAQLPQLSYPFLFCWLTFIQSRILKLFALLSSSYGGKNE